VLAFSYGTETIATPPNIKSRLSRVEYLKKPYRELFSWLQRKKGEIIMTRIFSNL
jgi:hypothetical protein